MNCQEVKKNMPDLLNDGVSADAASRLREHLLSCPDCRQEFQELNETWARLGILAEEQPGPGLRRDFYRRLESVKKELAPAPHRQWRLLAARFLPEWRTAAPVPRFAAIALVVALGFAAGFFSGSARKPGPGQLEALNREVDGLKQQVSLSL
ncbi:MAG TPA: zf-HC2 domain-containing protein, partial [Candidatus Binatia bacterium]|nr:zf-HC2 domain-containing protein [Candidatus Binatia bacterium]